jgi:hypothetical protein
VKWQVGVLTGTIFGVKSLHQLANLSILVCNTAVEISTHISKFEGSNTAATGTRIKKIMENT